MIGNQVARGDYRLPEYEGGGQMSEEFEFFVRADLSKYKGLYIAIIGRTVVASGDNAKIVWGKAQKKFPDKTPTIAKIPKDDTLILVTE